MRTYVLDANALVSYLLDRGGATTVQQLFREAQSRSAQLLMSSVNWGEVVCVLRRFESPEKVRNIISAVQRAVHVVAADDQTAERAAEIKTTFRVPYADAFAAELAMSSDATIVTSDRIFQKLGKNIRLRLLPSTVRR